MVRCIRTRTPATGIVWPPVPCGLLIPDVALGQLNSADSRLFLRNTVDGLPFAILGRLDPNVPGFSEAMAVGDFNCDGIEDLAIGAPDANANNVEHSGQIVIAYGSPQGLRSNDGIGLSQSSPNMPGGSEFADYFGWALAAGGLSDDSRDDLVVGTPGENFADPIPLLSLADAGSVTYLPDRPAGMTGLDTSGVVDAGAVAVLYGGPAGISIGDRQIWHKGSTGNLGVGDEFGAGLAAGDFNDDGVDDLVVATPQQTLGTTPRGGVLVIYGRRAAALPGAIFANGFE